ncbi:MAG TPA: histidine--tRNA ligase [Thermoanaerobaculia bacterium]|nr:histidine--tRNA ligase [Thermoanaerobaculia bacterium]
MSAPRSVKGMRDLLPPETAVWAAVEATARRVFSLYGFEEIRTPIVEETELFMRSVGESTDIVGKEMYTFEDKGGRSLTLRPESTAPVARAFVEHNLREQGLPLRLFYIGPQFRYERPQRGRYRQFHQIGAEVFGDPGPLSDVELLQMLLRFLDELGFEDLVVRLNTVGDRASRSAYAQSLREFLAPRAAELGEDSRRRLETNPLRILDTKLPRERRVLEDAPRLEEHLSDESREHFEMIVRMLAERGIEHQVDPGLVRGLDYYTRTVFEIASAELGAQDAILGGGRYDGLVADLGGPEVPALGFAIGEDRLIEVLPASNASRFVPAAPATVIAVGGVAPEDALRLAEELRGSGLAAVAELGAGAMKGALKRAGRRGSRYVLLLGDDELSSGAVTVKDFESGRQELMDRERVAGYLEERR